jgi:hypothetical protein
VGVAEDDEEVLDDAMIVGGCRVVFTGPSLNVDGGAFQETEEVGVG